MKNLSKTIKKIKEKQKQKNEKNQKNKQKIKEDRKKRRLQRVLPETAQQMIFLKVMLASRGCALRDGSKKWSRNHAAIEFKKKENFKKSK